MGRPRVVDYFCGLGGFTDGATMAGARVVCAINHNRRAVETHAANHPGVEHHCEDLTRFDPRKLPGFEILVAGCACQGHSLASGSENRKRTKVQRAPGELAGQWDADRATAWSVIDCAEIRRPRAIIVENVPRFLKWSLLRRWLGCLEDLNYGVRVQVLNSARWRVPQDRPRVYVVATLGREPPEIIEPEGDGVPVSSVLRFDRGEWTRLADKVEATRARAANGRAAFGDRFVMPYNGSGSGLTGRSIDRPIGTITNADRWAVVDGDRMRMLSIDELRACMGFREGYRVPPQREHATKMLGNANVPVVAMAAVAAVMKAVA